MNPKDSQEIKEYIAHSWYTYEGGDDKWTPSLGRRDEDQVLGAASLRSSTLEGHEKYSFLKTPRWKDNPMEVGPLARLLVAYASGHADVKETVNATLGKLSVPVDALFSTLGRTAARGIDCALSNDLAEGVLQRADRAREDPRDIDVQRREMGAQVLAR